ncbi:MAG: hypothetical protein ABIL09_11180 [Gemmatimonadota bacterium]
MSLCSEAELVLSAQADGRILRVEGPLEPAPRQVDGHTDGRLACLELWHEQPGAWC